MHHACLAHELDHLRGLLSVARQRFRADDRLARLGRDANSGEVEVVGQPDHHELDVSVCAELLHGRVLPRHTISTAEFVRSLLGARIVGHHLGAGDVTHAVHVEIGDEARTQHADMHDPPIHHSSPRSGEVAPKAPEGLSAGALFAFRAVNSSSIAAVWVAPTRVTPI